VTSPVQPIDMKELFVFVTVTEGIERIAMHPIDKVPLIYLQKNLIDVDIRAYLQSVADVQGVAFKLKHFKLVGTLEHIETMKTRITQ
jgi:hypothetical protein